jgi:hypothetical protein
MEVERSLPLLTRFEGGRLVIDGLSDDDKQWRDWSGMLSWWLWNREVVWSVLDGHESRAGWFHLVTIGSAFCQVLIWTAYRKTTYLILQNLHKQRSDYNSNNNQQWLDLSVIHCLVLLNVSDQLNHLVDSMWYNSSPSMKQLVRQQHGQFLCLFLHAEAPNESVQANMDLFKSIRCGVFDDSLSMINQLRGKWDFYKK